MKFLFSLSLLFAISATAQTFNYSNQLPWQATPIIHASSADNKAADAVYLNDARIVEYILNDKEYYMNMSYYKLIKVQTDKGIEQYNKVYIPMYRNSEILNLKARVILSNGKVIDVPQSKIKETEEDGRKYKLFALEGVEKNAEVEYTYTLKKIPNFFGSEIFQSTIVPVENASFTLICPSHLVFDAKGFNGITPMKDSAIDKLRYVVANTKMLKDISDAKYAFVDPYKTRIDYKLSYNLSKNNDVELYTWKEFAKNVYTNYTTLVGKEQKYLDKIISAMNIEKNTDEKTICKIEDYIKSNFNIDKELVGDNGTDFEKIFTTKNASDDGITRLMVNIFETYGIKYQLVFPSVRDELPLDEDLENWNRIENTLIYFPATGKYLTPTNITYRYPFFNPYEANTRGLFLKSTSIGSLKTAVGKFDDIALEPFEKNNTNMEVEVNFDADFDSVTMNSKQILSGYAAHSYRPVYVFLTKDKQDETTKDIMKSVGKSTNVVSMNVENAALINFNDNKPLTISGVVRSGALIDKAGNKLLFKIGDVIGQQEQMYQEKPRVLPVDMSYANAQVRNIKVNIPTGYVIKNLNDLNMNVQLKKEGMNGCGFKSSYTLNGNVLDITIREEYKDVHYELADYNDFKNVINAAADFNKIVLVMEKK